jgi:hypothetical protein
VIYAINYDLRRPGQNYASLHAAIKELGAAWWHYLGSTWLVDTHLNADQIWARLSPHVDTTDFVLVIRLANDHQGWLPKEAWDWINQRAFLMA